VRDSEYDEEDESDTVLDVDPDREQLDVRETLDVDVTVRECV
jgi:hypothetical protein